MIFKPMNPKGIRLFRSMKIPVGEYKATTAAGRLHKDISELIAHHIQI
jgi:hypothetical protein